MAIAPVQGRWEAGDRVPIIDNPIVRALHLPVEVDLTDLRGTEGVAGRQIIPLEHGRGDLSERAA